MSTHLTKITALAKKIRKAHPSKKWTDCVKAASKQIKAGKVGDYRINKTSFHETREATNPRKKRLKKEKKFSVTRTGEGKFKKIKRIAGVDKSMQHIKSISGTMSGNLSYIEKLQQSLKGKTAREKAAIMREVRAIKKANVNWRKAINLLKKNI